MPGDHLLIQPDDPRISWHGTISLERRDGWVLPWRIPIEDRALYPDPLLERACMPAGVRIAFGGDVERIAGHIEPNSDLTQIDLCCDGVFRESRALAGQDRFEFTGLPAGDKVVELWLPQFGTFRLRGIETNANASMRPYDDERPRWITYGSSITQCRTAERPTQTWPAVVARERNLNLTCLGYGGQCHLDVLIARAIRDVPADYISLCLGINVYGAASLSPRTFRPAIVGFVQIIREKHPDTPLVLLSPIFSPPRETTTNAVGFTLEAMRTEVAAAVEALRGRGDRHVHYVDGLRLFGPDLAAHLPDNLHPDAAGYKIMGRNFVREVADVFFT